MDTTRREFLDLTASSLALLAMPGAWLSRSAWAENGVREYLLVCDGALNGTALPGVPAAVSGSGQLNVFDVKGATSFSIDLACFGHIVLQNPVRRHQVVTFEKWGRHGALVDLESRSVIASTECLPDHTFFGHCTLTPDGTQVLTSEDSDGHEYGKLVVRDAANLKAIRHIQSYGRHPHQCQLLSDHKTILVANATYDGVGSNLAWIDLESGRLLNKVEFPAVLPNGLSTRPHGGFAHFAVSHDGWVCCGGADNFDNTPTAQDVQHHPIIAFVSPKGKIYYPALPKKVLSMSSGEALSVALLGQTGLVAFTIPLADIVLIFDYKTQRIVNHIDAKRCKGIVASADPVLKDHDLIISTITSLLESDLTSGKPPRVSTLSTEFGGRGSHMTRIYV